MRKRRLFSSLSTTINAFYLLLIGLFVLLTGTIIFYIANTQLSRNSEENMDNILNQKMEYLSFRYRDLFEQFYNLSTSVSVERFADAQAPSAQTFLDLSEEAEEFYNRNSEFIDSLFIYMDNGNYVIAESEQQVVRSDLDPETFYSQYPEAKESFRWINNHTDPVFTQQQEVQSLLRIVTGGDEEPAGVLLVNLKTAYIDSLLQENLPADTYMMLLNEEGWHIPAGAADQEELNEQVYALYREEALTAGVGEVASAAGAYHVATGIIPTNKWQVVLLSPQRSLIGSVPAALLLTLAVVLLLALLSTFFFRIIRRYISIPITAMSQRILQMEHINEKLEITPGIPQELAVLYESFNELAERNGKLLREITAEQEEKLDLEVALLHAQISPHFLYNTLYSIKGLCEMGLNQEASEMISKLSDFFRTSLSRGKEIIPIREELRNITSYLYIMEMRYGDFFTYSLEVPERLQDYAVVKLSLQPLVENAIYHGVMEDRGAGRIVISAEEEDETEDGAIILHVRDNGKGMDEQKLARIKAELHAPYLAQDRQMTGVGLRSVAIRIRNRYGSQYGLDITSEPGEFTDVSIRIPKVRGDELV